MNGPRRKRKWLAPVLACLLAGCLLSGAGPFGRTAEAAPTSKEAELAYESLTSFGETISCLAGESYYETVDIAAPGEYSYNLSALPTGPIGYRIHDLDGDGCVEMIVLEYDWDGAFGLRVYEYDPSGDAIYTSAYVYLPDDVITLKHELLSKGSGRKAIVDCFLYEMGGSVRIGIECGSYSDVQGYHRHLGLLSYQYKSETLTEAGKFNRDGTSSDYTVQDMAKIQQLFGVTPEINRISTFGASVKDYVATYGNIARVTSVPILSYQDASGYLNGGWSTVDWYRVHFETPDNRMPVSLNATQLRGIEYLFTGIPLESDPTYFSKDVLGGTYNGWHEGMRLDAMHKLLVDNLNHDLGNSYHALYPYGFEPDLVETSQGMRLRYDRYDVEYIFESLYGSVMPSYDFSSADYYADSSYVYFRKTTAPCALYKVDSVWLENGHLFAGGNVIWEEGSLYEYRGRFYGEIYENTYSLFGYTLLSVEEVDEPQYLYHLTAKASSALPDEGSFRYTGDMAVDGTITTAWNEGAPGLGEGEWLEIHTEGDQDELITALRLRNGYQKTDELFIENGHPVTLRLTFSDGTTLDADNLYYSDVISFGRPVRAHSVRLTILSAIGGSKYSDTCISEVELLTGEDKINGSLFRKPIVPEGSAPVTTPVTPEIVTPPHIISAETEAPAASTGDYILPESNTRLYSASELASLSAHDLWLARNEIYARHGRRFNNAELQSYFDGKSWYKGTIAPANFDEDVLNSYESTNIKTIQAEEAKR